MPNPESAPVEAAPPLPEREWHLQNCIDNLCRLASSGAGIELKLVLPPDWQLRAERSDGKSFPISRLAQGGSYAVAVQKSVKEVRSSALTFIATGAPSGKHITPNVTGKEPAVALVTVDDDNNPLRAEIPAGKCQIRIREKSAETA
jgi:hypothetical protein